MLECQKHTLKLNLDVGGVKIDTGGNVRAQSKEGIHRIYDALKIKKGDLVRVMLNDGKLDPNWEITDISGDIVTLNKQVGTMIRKEKCNLDYIKYYNPRGGQKRQDNSKTG